MLKNLLFLLTVCTLTISFAQRGKDLSYTVTAASTQLNSYTNVTADIAVAATTINVASNTLTNSFFTNPLAPGDLIMIIQMQGATMDIDPSLVAGGFAFTTPYGHNFDWWLFKELWGQVTAYNNAGKYELAEVRSVSGGTGITLQCGLKNAYTSAGHVQVVRVPRLVNLTLNANTSIVPAAWNGITGGVLSLEVNGTLTFSSNSKISATGFGFRGGITDNTTLGSPPGDINNSSFLGTPNGMEGAEKGEGIGGWTTEYLALSSRYGRGAPANGGGGGGNHNSGGGGGSNVGTGAYTGDGIPQPGYAAIWELEAAGFSTSASSGGGRGGYSYSTNDQNETTMGPKNTAWSGDYRRNIGGLGGHPLTVDATRIFAGGGGGAGDQNYANTNTVIHGGNGGSGGGIVYLTLYGSVTGTAVIEANGANGQSTNPNNVAATVGQKNGNDAAGGAGGGGAIVISNGTAIPATITLNANGGTGGLQNLSIGQFATPNEADGPGGGGTGGMIRLTSGSPVQTVAGGSGGTTNSTHVNMFPPNGSTNGAVGISGLPQPFFDISANNASICSAGSTTLTATVTGTLPGGAVVTWYSAQFGGTILGTGLTYNTGVLSTTTTVYVGTCPGTFRKPVTITVGGPVIAGTATVTNVTCSTGGSITGLTTSGGTPTVTISWNGVVTPGMNLTNASAGTYNVLVTDGSGCTATSGPYTIGTTGGPTVNTTNMVVTPASCAGNTGSITGITTTGSITSVSWNSGAYSTLDISSLPAGNYTLLVTDNLGCTASAGPIAVGSTAGPVISTAGMAIVNETCGLSNGSITGITATGTIASVSWNSGAYTTLDINSIPAGNYTLLVTDNVGCTATAGPFTVTNAAGPTLSTAGMTITDGHCGTNNGSISGIVINGGGGSNIISWNPGGYNTLNISGLGAGSYTLSVADVNGCTATAGPFAVANIPGPVVNTTAMVITPESCAGNDGAITGITATGAGTLTYQWNLVATPTADLTNKVAGNYILVVTDGFGCNTISGPHVIGSTGGPTINTTNVLLTNESCLGNDGAITGLTTTGTIVSAVWTPGAYSTVNITGITAGLYTLVVTDNLGCTATAGPFPIGQTPGPSISTTGMVIVNETCGNANASITGITATGTGLTYEWNGTASADEDLANVAAGNYTLVVENNLGCTATAGPFAITNAAGPTLTTTSVTVTDEHCSNASGSITGIVINGGTGTNVISWNSGAYNTLNITGLSAGTYSLTVTDANGCNVNAGPYTVSNIAGPAISMAAMVITPESCTGGDGSITGITATGTGTLTYQWNSVNSAGTDLNNVAAGNYTLTVSDAFGCSATSGPHTIAGAVPMSLNTANVVVTPAGCTVNNGAITGLAVVGGVSPDILWSNTATTASITGLAAGNYIVTVTDDQNCVLTASYTVGTAAAPVLSTAGMVTSGEHCGQDDGIISGIGVSGGTPAYTYVWDNDAALNTLNLTGAAAGSHTLVVTDAGGCTATTTVTLLDLNPTIDEQSLVVTSAQCNDSSGAISGLLVVAITPSTLSWTNTTQTTSPLTNIPAGTYVLTVTDPFGCTVSSSPIVVPTTAVPEADFNFSPSEPAPGEIVAFSDNSTGAIINDWIWNVDTLNGAGFNSSLDFPFVLEGAYPVTLIVTTADGCTDSITKIVTVFGNIVIPNVITRNNDGTNDLFVIKNLPDNSHVIIQNRWGNIVFESKDYQNDWKGNDQSGERLNEGVYTYQLINAEGKAWQGFVHLLNQ